MKQIILICTILLFAAGVCTAQNSNDSSEVIKVEADASKGFAYPYYLYIPAAMRETDAEKKTHSLLVIPNNSGKINDDPAFHEADVKRKMPQIGAFVNEKLKVVVLMPVFPRPAAEHNIYTHALDRDVMVTDKKELRRFDLQLLAMIEHARTKLKGDKIRTEEKVLMQGYSASGMFVNRFVFLHPERVKAAVIGSPGGWAIAPAETFKEKTLRYPVGTGDFKDISGRKFDLKKVRSVPIFMILGDQDTNDSVPFDDSYDKEERAAVMELFGKTPVERWEISRKLYTDAKLNAEFKLYPNVAHQMTKEMRDDMISFFMKYAL